MNICAMIALDFGQHHSMWKGSVMQTKLGHLVFGIDSKHQSFYRDVMSFLGWQILYDGEGMLGVGDSNGVSLWFGSYSKAVNNDYDGPGLNHVAISTATQDEVDQAVDYLAALGVEHLFSTPRHRPEFAADESSTYYQVMFETPDRILMEIVYTGPKQG
jgi:catechol 2,3-dioxygenase-like lactoylglutathione lyase family enzyme